MRSTYCFFRTANALAQLLTVPPYVVSAIVMVAFSFTSDRLQSRGILMAISSAIGGLGYLCVYFPTAFLHFFS